MPAGITIVPWKDLRLMIDIPDGTEEVDKEIDHILDGEGPELRFYHHEALKPDEKLDLLANGIGDAKELLDFLKDATREYKGGLKSYSTVIADDFEKQLPPPMPTQPKPNLEEALAAAAKAKEEKEKKDAEEKAKIDVREGRSVAEEVRSASSSEKEEKVKKDTEKDVEVKTKTEETEQSRETITSASSSSSVEDTTPPPLPPSTPPDVSSFSDPSPEKIEIRIEPRKIEEIKEDKESREAMTSASSSSSVEDTTPPPPLPSSTPPDVSSFSDPSPEKIEIRIEPRKIEEIKEDKESREAMTSASSLSSVEDTTTPSLPSSLPPDLSPLDEKPLPSVEDARAKGEANKDAEVKPKIETKVRVETETKAKKDVKPSGPPFVVNISWNELRNKIPTGMEGRNEIEKALKSKGDVTFQFLLDTETAPDKLSEKDFQTNFLKGNVGEFLNRSALLSSRGAAIQTPGAKSHVLLARLATMSESSSALKETGTDTKDRAEARAGADRGKGGAEFEEMPLTWGEFVEKIPSDYPGYSEIVELGEGLDKNFSISFLHDTSTDSTVNLSDVDLENNFGVGDGNNNLYDFIEYCIIQSKNGVEGETTHRLDEFRKKGESLEDGSEFEAELEDEPDAEKSPTKSTEPFFKGASADAGIYGRMRQQAMLKLADIATEERILSTGTKMDPKAFIRVMSKWIDKVNGKKGKKESLYENVKCQRGVGDSFKTTITLPDKTEEITHTYVNDRPKVTMTNPPSDQSIFLFMQSSKEMAPLTLQAPCRNLDTALKLYEASIISGTKIELHPDDEAALKTSDKHKDHFNALRGIENNDGDLKTFRERVKTTRDYELGKKENMPEPSTELSFAGPKGAGKAGKK